MDQSFKSSGKTAAVPIECKESAKCVRDQRKRALTSKFKRYQDDLNIETQRPVEWKILTRTPCKNLKAIVADGSSCSRFKSEEASGKYEEINSKLSGNGAGSGGSFTAASAAESESSRHEDLAETVRMLSSRGTKLHQLCISNNPKIELIRMFVQSDSSGVLTQKDAQGNLPLHIVLKKKDPDCLLISEILKSSPSTAKIRDADGVLPLFLACRNPKINFGTIRLLLQMYPQAASVRFMGSYALHTLLHLGDPCIDTVKLLTSYNPIAVSTPNNFGNLPLHYLTARQPQQHHLPQGGKLLDTSILRHLVTQYPLSVQHANKIGETPLMRAIVLYSSNVEKMKMRRQLQLQQQQRKRNSSTSSRRKRTEGMFAVAMTMEDGRVRSAAREDEERVEGREERAEEGDDDDDYYKNTTYSSTATAAAVSVEELEDEENEDNYDEEDDEIEDSSSITSAIEQSSSEAVRFMLRTSTRFSLSPLRSSQMHLLRELNWNARKVALMCIWKVREQARGNERGYGHGRGSRGNEWGRHSLSSTCSTAAKESTQNASTIVVVGASTPVVKSKSYRADGYDCSAVAGACACAAGRETEGGQPRIEQQQEQQGREEERAMDHVQQPVGFARLMHLMVDSCVRDIVQYL